MLPLERGKSMEPKRSRPLSQAGLSETFDQQKARTERTIYVGDLVTISSCGRVFEVIETGAGHQVRVLDYFTGRNTTAFDYQLTKLTFSEIMLWRLWQSAEQLKYAGNGRSR